MIFFRTIIFWISSIAATLFFAFLAFIYFNEYWTVKIKKDLTGYGWDNNISSNSWYYQTPQIYANAMLSIAICHTLIVLISIWLMIKNEKSGVIYSLLANIFLLLIYTFIAFAYA